MTREDLTDRERYVLSRVLDSERHGATWATLAYQADQEAARRIARLGLVEAAEDARNFIVRRANGVRIEDFA
ncbi:hypothetical protein CA606_18135 [Caulobacter vibrioides]|uniref:Uncharacterized protein n=1 Tax=Caulobacter vibrioides TaxID=155892 RepID=A0A290N2E0_CAUVI|nr:hypothetical protein [Caulobacter vibrioides]ATC34094.1 hypothetical protein CA606_18135 [Caulobacter vibrioides]